MIYFNDEVEKPKKEIKPPTCESNRLKKDECTSARRACECKIPKGKVLNSFLERVKYLAL